MSKIDQTSKKSKYCEDNQTFYQKYNKVPIFFIILLIFASLTIGVVMCVLGHYKIFTVLLVFNLILSIFLSVNKAWPK